MDTDAYRHGIKMHDGGYKLTDIPSKYNGEARVSWLEGWRDAAQRDLAMERKVSRINERGVYRLSRGMP